MAENVKGLTVKIGGDTSGLSKAISGVEKDVKSTQNELNKVNRLLKLDPSNVELLRKKQQLLNNEVTITRDKLKSLKEAEKKLKEEFAKGEVPQEQYEELKTSIIETELRLKSLERQAKKSNTTMARMGAIANTISNGARKVASATRGISTAAAAGITALSALVVNVAKSADDINTTSKKTGFTTEEIQQLLYAAELVDVSSESITSALTKLKSNISTGSTDFVAAMTQLGIAFKDDNGEFRNINDIFWETVQALGRINNDLERDTLAMQIFGRGANELAGIIDDGGEAFREYADKADEAGAILSQDKLDALNKFNDQLEMLKQNIKAAFATLAANLVETDAFKVVTEAISNAIQSISKFLKDIDPNTLATILEVLAALTILSPAASAIGGIAQVISTLSNPIVLAIAGIAAISVAVIAFQDQISAFGNWIIDGVTFINNKIKDFVLSIPDMIDKILGKVWNFIKSFLHAVWDAIEFVITSPLNLLIKSINKISGWVNNALGWNIGQIPELAMNQNTMDALTFGSWSNGSSSTPSAAPQYDNNFVGPVPQGAQTVDVSIEFNGSLAQLARVITPAVQAETNRTGSRLVSATEFG